MAFDRLTPEWQEAILQEASTLRSQQQSAVLNERLLEARQSKVTKKFASPKGLVRDAATIGIG